MAKKKNTAAVELGRKGGKKRAKNMTAKQLSEAASKAVRVRWERWRRDHPPQSRAAGG